MSYANFCFGFYLCLFTDELRRQQRKLLRLNRDKYFLFERLLAYEKPPPKQAAPKEETIEIVDGVPKVVRVGKKRGPKPKKRDPDSPPMLHFPNSGESGFEPGQSLLKLKGLAQNPGASPVRKRGPKKKEKNGGVGATSDLMPMSPTTASSSSSPPVTFSPGFSKNRTVPNIKTGGVCSNSGKKTSQKGGSANCKAGVKKSQSSPASMLMAQPPPQPELSNSTTQDSVLSFKSGDGGPPHSSEFFRHDSFSNEMPDNLFDD